MAKLPNQTIAENDEIKKGKGIRYHVEHLKDGSLVSFFNDGPFTGSASGKVSPGVGNQRLCAALRKRDSEDKAIFVVHSAEIADGVGGIKTVTGRDIPKVFDHLVGQPLDFARKDAEWVDAQQAHLADREAKQAVGKQQAKAKAESVGAEIVAAAEIAGAPVPAALKKAKTAE